VKKLLLYKGGAKYSDTKSTSGSLDNHQLQFLFILLGSYFMFLKSKCPPGTPSISSLAARDRLSLKIFLGTVVGICLLLDALQVTSPTGLKRSTIGEHLLSCTYVACHRHPPTYLKSKPGVVTLCRNLHEH